MSAEADRVRELYADDPFTSDAEYGLLMEQAHAADEARAWAAECDPCEHEPERTPVLAACERLAATPVLLALATIAAVLFFVHVAAWIGLAFLVAIYVALIVAATS